MRSKPRIRLSHKTEDGWTPWFAWYPVRIKVTISNPQHEEDYAWQWVWREPVEWKQARWVDIYYTLYRLPQ